MAAKTTAGRAGALFVALSIVALSIVALSIVAPSPAATGPSAARERAAVRAALGYLYDQQLQEPLDVFIDNRRVMDYPGDWPQFFWLPGNPLPPVRDVSPFTAAFIRHALMQVVEDNRGALRLSTPDFRNARLMRTRAVSFMRRFESPASEPDAGTFAFWPYDAYPYRPGPLVSQILVAWLGGPLLGGKRVPLNLPIFPNPLAIPSDADVTATTYAALLDDAAVDGGPGTGVAYERFFADWRDVGIVPRRLNQQWLPAASGAFLTWLSYSEPGAAVYPNDVDLVVNANVLYALGRGGRLNTPGVAESVDLINRAVALGLHRDQFNRIAEYYPDNLVFQYAVSRAFHEGGVTGLAPAVAILADELEASAIERPDGTAYWDRGAPQLNTAFAVLTLLNAGRNSPLVARAAAYLASEQGPAGEYDSAVFFIAPADNGQVFEFYSPSFTTAMALEALARHLLAR